MKFQTYEVAILLLRALPDLIEKIAKKDGNLGDQLRRAATSVPLNIKEGHQRVGKDRAYHFRVAAGSTAEVVACLDVADSLGYLGPDEIVDAHAYCDRVLAMLWRLTH